MHGSFLPIKEFDWRVLLSLAGGATATGVLGLIAWTQHDVLLWLAGTAGMGAGWVLGILASPAGPGEKTEFATYAKVGSSFLTGYLVSKFDRLFDLMTDAKGTPYGAPIMQPVVQMRVLMALCTFLLAFAVVFVGRRYGPPFLAGTAPANGSQSNQSPPQ